MAKTAKTTKYIREVKTSFKSLKTETIQLPHPQAVYNFLKERIGNETKEHFVILGVDNKNVVVVYNVVSMGTISESIVHPREVFFPVINTLCSGIILSHNHPSGATYPSEQDVFTTRRLVEAGKMLGIPVLDHIIIGNGYFSMKENGAM